LRKKLVTVPIENYFPEYKGGCDITKAKEFFKELFLARNKALKSVDVHFTCATDTTAMRAVMDIVIRDSVRKSLEFII